jgi:hypothetical protein
MNRPTLEVADIVRAAGNSFWERYGSRLAWPHRKVLDAIVRCRTVALGGHLDRASAAAIRPSRTTHAATGTAPGARATRVPGGWPRVRLSCCPCLTSISSSPCPTSSQRSSSRTRGCFMICSFAAVPRRCSKLPAIPSTSARRQGSSACSIAGDRTSSIMPTSITSFPLEV